MQTRFTKTRMMCDSFGEGAEGRDLGMANCLAELKHRIHRATLALKARRSVRTAFDYLIEHK